jgi:hypothetical protein
MCGLLASPDVDDPLVPEIAQKYIEDYNGYCENARLYTQRFATGQRPEYQDLIFSEDISQGDIEMDWVHSNNPHPESTIDTVSLSKSLPPSFPDLAEGWASTNGFEASSIHLEAENLYLYINGRDLRRYSWQLSGRDRSKTTLEGQSKSIDSSATLLLADLILGTRYHLQPRITRIEGLVTGPRCKITDLKISHSLLEAADAYLSWGSGPYFKPEDYLATSAFYKEAQNLCGDFLADWLAIGETKVQVLGYPASTWYQLSRTDKVNGYQIWNITKSPYQIEDLNAFLIAEFPDARLWGWDGTPTALDEPHPQVFALLFEHGLQRVFRSHAVQLLKRREFLSFVKPDFKPWYEPQPAPLMAAPGAFRNAMPSISTLIQSFIHPSLMNGIGIKVVDRTIRGGIASAWLWLENRDDGGANMRWVIKWHDGHDGQRFSDFRNITRIVRAHEISWEKITILRMSYRCQAGRDRDLSIDFRYLRETELCFEALQTLWQLDKLLRENADTGLLEDGPNLSDPDPAIPNFS